MIEPGRLADELGRFGIGGSFDASIASLIAAKRANVADYVAFFAAGHDDGRRRVRDHPR
jgi:hypothetical protein